MYYARHKGTVAVGSGSRQRQKKASFFLDQFVLRNSAGRGTRAPKTHYFYNLACPSFVPRNPGILPGVEIRWQRSNSTAKCRACLLKLILQL